MFVMTIQAQSRQGEKEKKVNDEEEWEKGYRRRRAKERQGHQQHVLTER